MARVGGIVCECNPYHIGHRRLFDFARETCDVTVAVMGGYFLQRGDSAFLPPSVRAKALIDDGFDVVALLPFPFSSASAEYFAGGGVSVLRALGCSDIYFGSECGDGELLSQMAAYRQTPDFERVYADALKKHVGTAAAFENVMRARFPSLDRLGPNDVLAIAYLGCADGLSAHALKRNGNYHAAAAVDGEYPSASLLRETVLKNGWPSAEQYLPQKAFEAYKTFVPGEEERVFLQASRFFFSSRQTDELNGVPYLDGGLGNALIKIAKGQTDTEPWYRDAVTKQYTLARIRRGVVFAMTGVTADDLTADVSYVRLLGVSQKGRTYLASLRRDGGVPVVTSAKGIPDGGERQKELDENARRLYENLCRPTYEKEIFAPYVAKD